MPSSVDISPAGFSGSEVNGSSADAFSPESLAQEKMGLGFDRQYKLGFAEAAESEKAVEHKKGKSPRKGWERRPASEEVRIFGGFESSDLDKTSVEHFAE